MIIVKHSEACFLFESDQRMPSRGFRPSQHGVTKKELVLERFKVQKSTPFGSVLRGSKRCHLPVICLGKTRRNPNINIILMFGFRVVFYRETKWPKCRLGGSQDVTGSAVMMSWERKRDFSGTALQTRSIGIAKRKHR